MKERPILFNAEMVRAILDGRKVVTRRIVNPLPVESPGYGYVTAFHADAEYSRSIGSTFAGRAVDPTRWWFVDASGPRTAYACPYGVPGDRLWVRETWRYVDWTEDGIPWIGYAADDHRALCEHVTEDWTERVSAAWAELSDPANTGIDGKASDRRWRPSIFMPRWASRITLEVTAVRVERLNGKGADAKCDGECGDDPWWVWVVEFRRVTP